jgi:hypothetical protein
MTDRNRRSTGQSADGVNPAIFAFHPTSAPPLLNASHTTMKLSHVKHHTQRDIAPSRFRMISCSAKRNTAKRSTTKKSPRPRPRFSAVVLARSLSLRLFPAPATTPRRFVRALYTLPDTCSAKQALHSGAPLAWLSNPEQTLCVHLRRSPSRHTDNFFHFALCSPFARRLSASDSPCRCSFPLKVWYSLCLWRQTGEASVGVARSGGKRNETKCQDFGATLV